jgi:hypothetical protein
LRENTDCWNTISRSVPSYDRRILAFGVLADDDEVDVAGLAVGERRRDAGHQLARAQVHVLVELAAEQDERAPQRHVVGHGGGPADRAVVDRLERGQLREPVVGHHLPVLRVVIAAPVERRRRERDAELARRRLDHAHAFRHDLLADAVAGDHGDPVRGHGPLPGAKTAILRVPAASSERRSAGGARRLYAACIPSGTANPP